VKYNP